MAGRQHFKTCELSLGNVGQGHQSVAVNNEPAQLLQLVNFLRHLRQLVPREIEARDAVHTA